MMLGRRGYALPVDRLSSLYRYLLNSVPCARSLSFPRVQEIDSIESSSDEEYSKVKSTELTIKLKNRNPRNPEHFGWNKPRGFETQYYRRDFYCRLVMLLTNRHVKAYIEHYTGRVLASASTTEFHITKHLHKPTGSNAAHNIGRVLAQRCLEAGITRVLWAPRNEKKKERIQTMKRSFKAAGISLSEPGRKVFPEQVVPTGNFYKRKKKNPYARRTDSEKRWFT